MNSWDVLPITFMDCKPIYLRPLSVYFTVNEFSNMKKLCPTRKKNFPACTVIFISPTCQEFFNMVAKELPYAHYQFQVAKCHLKKGFNTDRMCRDGTSMVIMLDHRSTALGTVYNSQMLKHGEFSILMGNGWAIGISLISCTGNQVQNSHALFNVWYRHLHQNVGSLKTLKYAIHAGHIRHTSANVRQRALTLPDILSGRVQYMEIVWQGGQ